MIIVFHLCLAQDPRPSAPSLSPPPGWAPEIITKKGVIAPARPGLGAAAVDQEVWRGCRQDPALPVGPGHVVTSRNLFPRLRAGLLSGRAPPTAGGVRAPRGAAAGQVPLGDHRRRPSGTHRQRLCAYPRRGAWRVCMRAGARARECECAYERARVCEHERGLQGKRQGVYARVTVHVLVSAHVCVYACVHACALVCALA